MKFLKSAEQDYRPLLAPLIDIVFLLLIFFMVSTVFIDFQRKMEIRLPESRTSVLQDEPEPAVIEMTKQEQLLFNGVPVSFEQLGQELLARTDIDAVIVRADKDLPYGQVIRVMGLCQSVGISVVGAAVRPEQLR